VSERERRAERERERESEEEGQRETEKERARGRPAGFEKCQPCQNRDLAAPEEAHMETPVT